MFSLPVTRAAEKKENRETDQTMHVIVSAYSEQGEKNTLA